MPYLTFPSAWGINVFVTRENRNPEDAQGGVNDLGRTSRRRRKTLQELEDARKRVTELEKQNEWLMNQNAALQAVLEERPIRTQKENYDRNKHMKLVNNKKTLSEKKKKEEKLPVPVKKYWFEGEQ